MSLTFQAFKEDFKTMSTIASGLKFDFFQKKLCKKRNGNRRVYKTGAYVDFDKDSIALIKFEEGQARVPSRSLQ